MLETTKDNFRKGGFTSFFFTHYLYIKFVMTISLKNMGEKLFIGYLYFVGVWLAFALSFDLFMIGVHFTSPELETKISNEISWKIDGTFANNPDNIWYNEDKNEK